jgi:hypothetical protein
MEGNGSRRCSDGLATGTEREHVGSQGSGESDRQPRPVAAAGSCWIVQVLDRVPIDVQRMARIGGRVN